MLRRTVSLATGQVVHIATSERSDGDFARLSEGVDDRRRDFMSAAGADRDWPLTWLKQVHGATVVDVATPGEAAGSEADGALTRSVRCPISVITADCLPVVLVSTTGVAVVHAGWKGARAGIIEKAGERLRADGSEPVFALVGPAISAPHYEFGADDLATMTERFGPTVAAVSQAGTPALDMGAVAAAACIRAGWPAPEHTACTSEARFYSHRVRQEAGRQITLAWLDDR